MKGAYERPLGKAQPICRRKCQRFADASTMGCSPRTAAAVEWYQANKQCVGRGWSNAQAPWRNQKIMSESQITGHKVIYTVGVWCCFVQPVGSPLKKVFNLSFCRSPQLKDFDLLKRDFGCLERLDILKRLKILCVCLCKDCGTFKVIYVFNVRSWGQTGEEQCGLPMMCLRVKLTRVSCAGQSHVDLTQAK